MARLSYIPLPDTAPLDAIATPARSPATAGNGRSRQAACDNCHRRSHEVVSDMWKAGDCD